ncbi:hypothetical protein [Hymenobacter jejuensis]|uniref:Uncharacterized protein n=1 Tax=Hymenobacter jejuensis TaxID=2502781 RepID=A0A5B8A1Q4_9BACT|nr:hypothetical protein [Hymenobacter jejuensis]QDA61311.1 hypothetical protein FHG12_14955 [Hymenobacter jejuensis]
MKYLSLIALTFLIYTQVFGQGNKGIINIKKEGKYLYRSEMASWLGSDIFTEKFKEQQENIGGYFSYPDNERTNCVFFSKDTVPKVIATISFDSTYNISKAIVDSKERVFLDSENDLYTIRRKALEIIRTDTLFKVYQNTRLNLIPIIQGDERKVYVLTGPQVSNVVIFGNDYKIDFNKFNEPTNRARIHNSIIPIEYKQDEQKGAVSMHSHLPETGEYITSTDICTLMLYEKFVKWKQHIVISKTYVSIWSCDDDQLLTLTKKAWEKIYINQKKRN